ncbi:MAG: TIGR03960 family B12-binding radical SAM protein [Lachnospiraceae bacterium]|nr:TIGR03960 family B12-binding radical SAM protein [Lachnospiraceae bacterium]
MRKLALSDDILMQVEKPARYIGNEVNSIIKDADSVALRYAICFPDVYEIGMSNLAIQILYEQFNRRDDVWCERVFSPWPDLHKVMKEKSILLFGLESQEAIRDFDFIGMTMQYEMCYTNILQIIDLAGLPLLAADRTDDMPIVMSGGPCSYNPEPIADFFDIIYIGEGETSYDALFDLYIKMKKSGSYSRKEFLHKASVIPGIYVPTLYEPEYNADGTLTSFKPVYDDVPSTVERQVVVDMDDTAYPMKPVVPHVQAIQDRVTLEIMRGCIRGCRFCQAGMIYRPKRERSLETLENYAVEMLKNSGHEEISLSSLSSSDYSHLPELLDFLIEQCDRDKVNISLPSLRIDNFSLDVMSKVQDVRKSSITFAPEAGSQRMRDVINKGLSHDDIINGSRDAFLGGWNKVKLYFMLGLPTETEEDMRAIPELGDEIAMLYYDTIPKVQRQGRCQVTMSTSFFVPKPFTPFQWARMYEKEEYLHRAKIVNDHMKEMLNKKSLRYQWHQADVTVLEGIFARGDRRIAQVIMRAYELGCFFDAWGEYFDLAKWEQAFADCGVDGDFYIMRERPEDELFPWDFIDCKVSKKFLLREWHNAKAAKVTKNCKEGCAGCGAAVFKTGVCTTH